MRTVKPRLAGWGTANEHCLRSRRFKLARPGPGKALGNPVLVTEGQVTLVDGILTVAVLAGLALNAAVGWWWADPLAAVVIVFYAPREIFLNDH
jgi:hypothetical protein